MYIIYTMFVSFVCLMFSAAMKKLYRRSYVDSLDQLKMVVNCVVTPIILGGVLCNLYHSTGRVCFPKHSLH